MPLEGLGNMWEGWIQSLRLFILFVLLVAHSDAVTCVASCPGKDTVFLSCAEVKLTLFSKSTPFKRDLTLGIYSLIHLETTSCVATCLPVLLHVLV